MVVLGALSPFLRVLVWALVLGGLVVFIWRRVQGVPIRGSAKETPSTDDSSVPRPPPATLYPTEVPAAPPTTPAVPPSAPEAPPSPFASVSPTSSAEPAAPSIPATPVPPTDPDRSARSGFFAGAAPGDTTEPSAPGTGRPTVAEAVRGITMPCGLSPVVDGTVSIPNPFRVAFLTTTATAAEVGTGIADELERLGFSLSTSTATELLARRDAVEMRVVLYPSPAAAKRGLDPIFPVAPAGAIGLELVT